MCNATDATETGEWVCIRKRHDDVNHFFTKVQPVSAVDVLIVTSNVLIIVSLLLVMAGIFIAWFDIMPEWNGIVP